MVRRATIFLKMGSSERRMAVRRRIDHVLQGVFLRRVGGPFNSTNRFAYLSSVPDAVRLSSALPHYGQLVRWWTYNNPRNAGDLPRLLFLVQNARRVLDEGVPGDFAEVGVYKGNSAKVLSDVLRRADASRSLYLFDTFGGFDARDLAGVDAKVPTLFSDVTLTAVKQFLAADGICDFRPGYFPQTADALDPGARFALVHLDCDLHEPMRAGLRFFYPRLNAGALVIVHDYASGLWPGATQAVDEFLAHKSERLVLLPDRSGTAIFRKN